MGDKINSFEDLDAWESARELVRLCSAAFRRDPAFRDFGLRDQVQRAAIRSGKPITGLLRSTEARTT
jgi:hypothetical protein